MRTSQRGLDLIKEFEGFKEKAYMGPGGKWTIGYGHTAGVRSGDVITMSQAEMYLKFDVGDAEIAVMSLVQAPLSQNQFDALVSFVYNVGSGNFYNSTLRRLINERCSDADKIKRAFLMWRKAQGRTLSGLVKRREAEFKLFSSNE